MRLLASLLLVTLLTAGCASKPNLPADAVEPNLPADAVEPLPPLGDSVPKDTKKIQTRALGLPTVLVPAHYPQKALDNGIEGYVILEYAVTKDGTVRDAVVIDSSPLGYFEQAALKAATEFRYNPKIVNGEPVDVPRARYRLDFKFEYLRSRK